MITRGMIMSGRKTNLMIALEDKPGQLTRVSEIISGMGPTWSACSTTWPTPT